MNHPERANRGRDDPRGPVGVADWSSRAFADLWHAWIRRRGRYAMRVTKRCAGGQSFRRFKWEPRPAAAVGRASNGERNDSESATRALVLVMLPFGGHRTAKLTAHIFHTPRIGARQLPRL
eukprot:scaffold2136_cov242-Pinguiococcus_pyrenoidosus.AAC.24